MTQKQRKIINRLETYGGLGVMSISATLSLVRGGDWLLAVLAFVGIALSYLAHRSSKAIALYDEKKRVEERMQDKTKNVEEHRKLSEEIKVAENRPARWS